MGIKVITLVFVFITEKGDHIRDFLTVGHEIISVRATLV